MQTVNRHQWMIWAIIILALMNITTFITILIHSNRSSQEVSPQLSEELPAESASLQYSGRYFRDQLGLNREQMSRFSEFNPEFRRNVRDINISLANIRLQMINEMADETSDTVKLNQLSDSIGSLHADLKKLTYKYYFDFKNICNEEQQQKLEELFMGMFSTDYQMVHYVPRGPAGRGGGRRFAN